MKTTTINVRCPVEYAETIARVASRRQMTPQALVLELLANGLNLPVHTPRPAGRPKKEKRDE
jgi:hypothetical protein